jgi:hypothetical protein
LSAFHVRQRAYAGRRHRIAGTSSRAPVEPVDRDAGVVESLLGQRQREYMHGLVVTQPEAIDGHGPPGINSRREKGDAAPLTDTVLHVKTLSPL